MLKIAINLLLIIHVIVSLLMILVVLMQRPKSEGLGAAFGGGLTDNLFGAQTTNALQSITRWLAGLFFALTLTLAVLYSKQATDGSALGRKLRNESAPAAETAPAPATTPATAPAAEGSPGAAAPEAAAPAAAPAPEAAPADATPAGAVESKPSEPVAP
jgi:preprotein translocase subunit SecG